MTINTEMTVRVASITQAADKVKRFRFERADGQPMPIFSGGAHVVVSMRDGQVGQLEDSVNELRTQLGHLTHELAHRDARIAQLDQALGDLQRALDEQRAFQRAA